MEMTPSKTLVFSRGFPDFRLFLRLILGHHDILLLSTVILIIRRFKYKSVPVIVSAICHTKLQTQVLLFNLCKAIVNLIIYKLKKFIIIFFCKLLHLMVNTNQTNPFPHIFDIICPYCIIW